MHMCVKGCIQKCGVLLIASTTPYHHTTEPHRKGWIDNHGTRAKLNTYYRVQAVECGLVRVVACGALTGQPSLKLLWAESAYKLFTLQKCMSII